jgi:hypothetical protein
MTDEIDDAQRNSLMDIANDRTRSARMCSFGEPFAHSRNSDLPAVRISNDDAYIVGV